MAWIRTGFSMISFGFTLIKTFQYLKDSTNCRWINLGATLIVLGTVSRRAASWQHWRLLRQMSGEGHPQFSLALVIALILTLVVCPGVYWGVYSKCVYLNSRLCRGWLLRQALIPIPTQATKNVDGASSASEQHTCRIIATTKPAAGIHRVMIAAYLVNAMRTA